MPEKGWSHDLHHPPAPLPSLAAGVHTEEEGKRGEEAKKKETASGKGRAEPSPTFSAGVKLFSSCFVQKCTDAFRNEWICVKSKSPLNDGAASVQEMMEFYFLKKGFNAFFLFFLMIKPTNIVQTGGQNQLPAISDL